MHNYLPYLYSKNIGRKKLWWICKLQQFAKFFANFHNFCNIPYANGLKLAKVIFHQTSLQSLFAKLLYQQNFLLYSSMTNEVRVTIRPPLVYYLFPIPIFSTTEAGRRWLLIIYYANEPMQNVIYIKFNHVSNTFYYYFNA